MTKLALGLVFFVALVGSARADVDIVVFGPAIDSKLAKPRARLVETAVAKAAVGKAGERPVDTLCVADTLCLQGHGSAVGAVRLLAIAAAPAKTGAGIDFTLVIVDVEAKELVAKRDVTIPDARIARQLGGVLKKFLDEGPVERAKTLFDQGNQHYNLGEFAKALESYKRAYRVKALPAFLFNIAQCHRKLEQHREAVAMYQSYLLGVPDAANKALVESLIAESKTKLAEVARLSEESDKAKREREKLDLERKRAEEDRKAKEAAAVAASEKSKVEQARISVERERELDKTYNRHPARKWTIIAGSVGAAAAIAGGVFGLSARNAQSDFDSAGCGEDRFLDEPTLAKCVGDRDRGERNARLANILIGGGGAVLLGSVIVFAIDPGNLERPTQARAQLGVSPNGVKVVIKW
jgi:tetratricopeptide (TPR) repeat protein